MSLEEREEKSSLFARDALLEIEIYADGISPDEREKKEAERHQVLKRIEALLRQEGKLS